MLIFPVRHHSPAAALQVTRLIRERRPRVVLVEGPADADGVIPLLLDRATVPPVAIYAYRTDAASDADRAQATYYPLCGYSPEQAALKAGQEVGAELRFCDLPASAWVDLGGPREDEGEHGRGGASSEYAAFTARLAEAAGFETFEAFWEAAFEQECGRAAVDRYLAAFADYGAQVRSLVRSPHDQARDDLRERYMAAFALDVIASGTPAQDVILVCGAAHAAAIETYVRGSVEMPALGEGVPMEIALIPFSFPRLSEQLGYGAGNRAPWFYQRVWELDGDYESASRQALVSLARALRRQGQAASLAQGIDADRLAGLLAGMRGKTAPGVDEVTDAAIACFGQGKPLAVSAALREVLIGQDLGRVTPRAGRTPLQTEFYATAQGLRLPILDAARQILVHVTTPEEAAQSVFLHRLVTADVPFARELESGLGGRGRTAAGGPLEQLGRVREKWELCWTPLTDARLVERNAWGGTLPEVCERLLGQRLAAASRIDDGTTVLLHLALCDLPAPFPAALTHCETLAADSASFPALARGAFHLDGLLAYGPARRLPERQLADLAARLFVRAALHLPAAAGCADEAAAEVESTLTPLADLVRRGRATAAPAVFWESIETVAAMEGSHPGLRGLALTLLELNGRLQPGELARRLRSWLSPGDAAANARLIAGVFALHRSTLIRGQSLIGAVTDFLLDLEIEALIPLLPPLRRTLGDLSPAERAYLTETLSSVLGLEPGGRRAVQVDNLERAQLREADAAVAATLAEWRERYGIG